ncbi:GFA family protein [Albibacillus kandeliae]|uniref:GFA family protein n=1 Tax=Albibacillus kandeliae TaxID=2174228 RepID=UPI001E59B03A|nr:GFA family protein [Albibacillus kandeliae]
MSERTGQCMCGAVSFTAKDVPDVFGACHCEMCRRWTGSALLAVTVPGSGLTWTGEAHIRTLQSSDWAERAWCQRCGSGLYYHVTAEGPMSEGYEIPIGLFDNLDGMSLGSEIYIDHKPEAFAFAGEHKRLTRSEILSKLGVPEENL